MALTAISEFIFPPMMPSGLTATSLLCDATGERVGSIFQCRKTGNVHKIHFPLGAVTTGQTLKSGFQTVQTSDGLLDGTYTGSGANAGTVAVADADDNAWKTVTLTSDKAVTIGDMLAVAVEFNSTIGSLNILCASAGSDASAYVVASPNGATAKQSSRGPLVVLEYDDGSVAAASGVLPGVPSGVDFASNTTPDEIGARFRLPFACRIHGLVYDSRMGGDADFVLYAADGTTVLASASRDKDVTQGTTVGPISTLFASEVTLAANTYCHAAIKPTTATTVRMVFADVSTAAHMDQWPGAGQDFHYASRTDAGSWTYTLTRRPNLALLISGIDIGGGGGVSGARIFNGF